MLITAKYKGRCVKCALPIKEGDRFVYHNRTPYCINCGKEFLKERSVNPVLTFKDGVFIWYADRSFNHLVSAKQGGAGFVWNPDLYRWETPYKSKAMILKAYADDSTLASLQEEIQAQQASIAANPQSLPEEIQYQQVSVPEGLSLLPFQKAGIQTILRSNKTSFLIADEMGLGKTVQALTLCRNWNCKKVLAVVPASLRRNWLYECRKWYPEVITQVVRNGSEDLGGQFIIMSYESATKRSKELMEIDWDCVICDESHYLKNSKAQRTKSVIGYWDKAARERKEGILSKGKRNILLTGTPILNRPIELWTTIEALGMAREFGGFKKYATMYCDAHYNGFGWDFGGANRARLPELQNRLRMSGKFIRRLKSDVLTELPPKIRQVIPIGESVTMSDRERAMIEALQRSWSSDIQDLEGGSNVSFEKMSSIRHMQAVEKTPYVIEYLIDAMENLECAIVFAHHREVIEKIGQALNGAGIETVIYYGGMSDEAKEEARKRFQEGSARVFVGSISAAGVGLTLTKASTVFFAELDWRPAYLDQAIDRAHRIGQTDSVLAQLLVIDGSFDSYLAKMIVEKLENINLVMTPQPEPRKEDIPSPSCETLDEKVQEAIEHNEKRSLERAKRKVSELGRKRSLKSDSYDESPCTERQNQAIMLCCAHLAADDPDRAMELNGVGFNKGDSHYGHSIAQVGIETKGEAKEAFRMLIKYVRQLPVQLLVELKDSFKEK